MKKILILIILVMSFSLVLAADFTPQGDINMRGVYAMKNATNVNGTGNFTTSGYFVGDGTYLTNVNTTNSTYQIWAYNQTIPAETYATGLNGTLATWVDNLFIRFTEVVGLVGNWSLDKVNYYSITQVNTNISSQNTSMGNYVDGQDTTFNNSISSWVDLLFPRTSELVGLIGNWTADKTSYSTTTQANLLYSPIDEPLWTANQSAYSTTADIVAFGYYNSTDFVITDYFTKAQVLNFGYYNSTDFSIADYFTSAEVLAFNYYNSTDFNINDYTTTATLLGYNYYNSTDFSISDYYLQSNPLGYYNSTTIPVDVETLWNANYSAVELGRLLATNNTYYLASNPSLFIDWDTASNGTLVITEIDPHWSANYSGVEIGRLLATNGTYYLASNPDLFTTWAITANGTLALTSEIPTNNNQLLNGFGFYNSTSNIGNWTLDKPGYATLTILNNGSYLNDFDYWSANYSDYLTLFLWNETHADELYAGIEWDYNQTIPANAYTDSVNGTMALFVNSEDLRFNGTAAAYTDSKLITTFYNASAIQVVTGTGQGAIGDLRTYNGVSYNVSEVDSDFDFRVNFTGVTGLNQLVYRYKSTAEEQHIMHTQIWDYGNDE